ncbi:GNAT family N-acetyltransferase [Candidatus Micrarchaeota archaeon]|nr:GNAT family N-acetyltransferase [Candidatus Micrarchaeota archaeon]
MSEFKKFKPVTRKLGKASVLLREVKHSDAAGLNEIINDPKVREFISVEGPVSLSETKAKIRESLRNAAHKWIVAEADGKVVGSLYLTRNKGIMSHSGNFGISLAKEEWGTGLASALMDAVFAFAKRNGITAIHSSTGADNKRAHAFYKKKGFKFVGAYHKQRKRGRKFIDTLLMEKFF